MAKNWREQQAAYDRGETTDTSWKEGQRQESRSHNRNDEDPGITASRQLNGTDGPEWDDYAFTAEDL